MSKLRQGFGNIDHDFLIILIRGKPLGMVLSLVFAYIVVVTP